MKQIVKEIIVAILTWEAKAVLRKYKPKIVAVTGSVGKTSTKDAIFTVLSEFYFVRKSEKSFNSEIGVPLTILGCPTGWNNPLLWLKNIAEGLALILLPNVYPKWLVLEVGADRPGDIESITDWLRPDVSVVTRLSKVPVHVEFFENAAAVYREKAFLVKALKKDGVLILNSDDEDVLAFKEFYDGPTLLFGTHSVADVIGTSFALLTDEKQGMKKPSGVSFDVSYKAERGTVEVHGGLGVQQMYPALAGIAVAMSQGLDLKKAIDATKKHHTSRGRMKIVAGIKQTTIIDDSYNSSPVALAEALRTLQDIKTNGRKIAVLGDMLELGAHTTEEHKKAGEQASKTVSTLYTVGVRARGIAEGALVGGMHEENIFQYEDSQKAGKDLELKLMAGDIVLVKGSQGIRMEKAVEEIMENPEMKESLLVRQDKEWEKR